MKKYVFKPYSNIFPELFDKEKERIAPHLKMALAIEHVGSTAIPKLGGKGIIDIAIAVNKEDMDPASTQLQSLGYEFRPSFSTPDRFYFIIYLPDPEEKNRRYHIHLTYPENNEWKEFLGFRDYLRNHPEELQEYAELKKKAALDANHEGERYRKLKEPMFKKISSLINKTNSYPNRLKINFKKASSHGENLVTLEAVPAPTGPYRIGTIKYDLNDIYRKELKFPDGRLIPIQIYFPTQKGTHALYPKIFEDRVPGPWEPLKVNVHSQATDLSLLADGKHAVIFLNHAKAVAMTDYAFLAEDLSSHGYVVISIQHQLLSDGEEPPFWKGSSLSRNAKVIDNMLYVFEWLKEVQVTLFAEKIDLKRIGLIGHSMGGNSLLLLANRSLDAFKKNNRSALLPRTDQEGVKECLILMETTGFPYPIHNRYPLFFLLSEERESYQRKTGCFEEMIQSGHKVRYYKGSTHTSFMDHGYINPPDLIHPNEHYFNGTLEERIAFFDEVRRDIRDFIKKHIGEALLNDK